MHASRTAALIVADASGVITHWSDGAAMLFGYEGERALGRSLDLIVPEAFRERHWAGFRRAMERAAGAPAERVANLPVRCADGAVRAFPGRLVLLSGPRGEPAGAAAIFGERAGDEEQFGPVRPVS